MTTASPLPERKFEDEPNSSKYSTSAYYPCVQLPRQRLGKGTAAKDPAGMLIPLWRSKLCGTV